MSSLYVALGSHRELTVVRAHKGIFPCQPDAVGHLPQRSRITPVPYRQVLHAFHVPGTFDIRMQQHRHFLVAVTIYPYGSTVIDGFHGIHHVMPSHIQPSGLYRIIIGLNHQCHVSPLIAGIQHLGILPHDFQCQVGQRIEHLRIVSAEACLNQGLRNGVYLKTVHANQRVRKHGRQTVVQHSLKLT